MAAAVAAVPPKYEHENKPVSPSSTTTRGQNSFGTDDGRESSISSKTHEVSQSASTFSVESQSQALVAQQQSVSVPQRQQREPRKIGRWYIGETLGKGGYSWYECK